LRSAQPCTTAGRRPFMKCTSECSVHECVIVPKIPCGALHQPAGSQYALPCSAEPQICQFMQAAPQSAREAARPAHPCPAGVVRRRVCAGEQCACGINRYSIFRRASTRRGAAPCTDTAPLPPPIPAPAASQAGGAFNKSVRVVTAAANASTGAVDRNQFKVCLRLQRVIIIMTIQACLVQSANLSVPAPRQRPRPAGARALRMGWLFVASACARGGGPGATCLCLSTRP
jgi:hypothetical protein